MLNADYSRPFRRSSAIGARAPLTQQALSASAVEAAAFVLTQLLRLGSSLILTRVLFPEAFGVMAMLSMLLYGLHMLSDVGILQAVVRSPRGEQPAFLHTAFTIQFLRGLALWVVAAALAWPLSLLFREPRLSWIVPLGSLDALLYGLTSLRTCLLRRQMRPLPLATLELSAQVAGFLASVTGAKLLGWGVGSLVFGSLLNSCVHTVGSHLLPHPHRDRFSLEPAARQEILSFGRWILASSAITFLAGRGDQIVLGRLLGASSLGLYNIALTLAEAPESLAGRFMSGVLYPIYARVFNQRADELPRVYYRSRLAFDALMQGSIGGLCALAPWLIATLYDGRYQAAALMLQLLSLRGALTLMAVPCESVLVARGLSAYSFRSNLTLALGVLVLLPVGYALAGMQGVLWAMVAARAAALFALWLPARSHGMLRLTRELLAPLFLASGYLLGRGLMWTLAPR